MDAELNKKFENLVDKSNNQFMDYMKKSANEAFNKTNQLIKENFKFISDNSERIPRNEISSIKRCIDICVDGFIDYFYMKFPDFEDDFDIPYIEEVGRDKLVPFKQKKDIALNQPHTTTNFMSYPRAAFWGDINPYLLYSASENEYSDFLSLKEILTNS